MEKEGRPCCGVGQTTPKLNSQKDGKRGQTLPGVGQTTPKLSSQKDGKRGQTLPGVGQTTPKLNKNRADLKASQYVESSQTNSRGDRGTPEQNAMLRRSR